MYSIRLFPSSYGKFISLNFSRYLTGPIETEEQKNAFQEIIEFFDNVPDMTIPIHLQEYLDQYLELYSREEGTEKINSILQGKQDAMQDINAFVDNNKEILDAKENFLNTLKSLLRIKYKVYFFFCNSFIAIDKVELSVNLDICNGKGGKVIATARNWFICKSNHVVVSDEVTYH